jgi:chemotaxis protein MotB
MSNKKKKADEEDDMPTAPAWMATFSDMMTLLMCFFILIMSFSTMELDKFKMAMGSLKGAFGVLGVQKRLMPQQSWWSPASPNVFSLNQRSVLEHLEKLRSVLENNELSDKVDAAMREGEVFIEIKDNMLFNAGSAELKLNYTKLLAIIGKLFFKEAKQIMIEGHTDNVPIKTDKYPSNWELSMDRALTVVRYYINEQEIDPGKIAAAGFGEFKPIAPNDTPENRSKNRRVVIRMKI